MTELALFEALALDCRVGTDGTVRYYNSSGQLHRVYGPAIECPNGSKFWYQNGQLHRLNGPAVEWPDGTHDWYINHRNLTEVGWQEVVASMGSV
jgi:hypothetical protein